MTDFRTEMSADEMAQVPAGPHSFITYAQAFDALGAPSGSRPRIYGYLERGESAGQIVKLASQYYLEMHGPNLGFAWVSDSTIADFIRAS